MSRFNQLYLADAETVREELQDTVATPEEVTITLLNMLGMISTLQDEVRELRSLVTPVTR